MSFRSRFSFIDRHRFVISVGHQPIIRQLDTGPAWSSPDLFPSPVLPPPAWNARLLRPIRLRTPDASRRAAGEVEASTACWLLDRSRFPPLVRSRSALETGTQEMTSTRVGDGADWQETQISGHTPCRVPTLTRGGKLALPRRAHIYLFFLSGHGPIASSHRAACMRLPIGPRGAGPAIPARRLPCGLAGRRIARRHTQSDDEGPATCQAQADRFRSTCTTPKKKIM